MAQSESHIVRGGGGGISRQVKFAVVNFAVGNFAEAPGFCVVNFADTPRNGEVCRACLYGHYLMLYLTLGCSFTDPKPFHEAGAE